MDYSISVVVQNVPQTVLEAVMASIEALVVESGGTLAGGFSLDSDSGDEGSIVFTPPVTDSDRVRPEEVEQAENYWND
mgnify:CR=1 FL=1